MHIREGVLRFILVAHDRLFQQALAAQLAATGLEVAHVARDLDHVPNNVLAQPGVILVIHVTGDEAVAFDMLKDVKSANPGIKLVVITRSGAPATVAACLEIGVSTILDEDVSFDSLLSYLRFVALDERALPVGMVNAMLNALRPYVNTTNRTHGIPVDLTPRERVVLAYLTEGASNKHIARYLGISDGTVKVNVKTILRKIHASNRTQAAVWGLQHDIRGCLLSGGVELNGASPG